MRRPALQFGPLAVVLSNLVPLVGVLAFGWSAAAILGIYLGEVLVVLCWALVKMPFAAKRPNNDMQESARLLAPIQAKRGATSLPGPFPDVYLRNLPTVLVTVFLLAPLEAFVVLMVFALPDPTITDAVAGQLLLGWSAAFVGHGVETYTEYFRNRGYEDHSPRSLLLGPFKYLFAVGGLMLVFTPLQGTFESRSLLVVVVLGKGLYDLRTLQVARDDDRHGVFYRLYGSEETEINPISVHEPDREPDLAVRPSRRVALVDALYRGVTYSVSSTALLFYGLGVVMAALGATPFAVLFLGVGCCFTLLRAAGRYLTAGTVEYRVYGDTLVAYDALLDEPQARLEAPAVTDWATERDRVDRLFDTHTLELEAVEPEEEEEWPPMGLALDPPDPEELGEDDANENKPMTVPHVTNPDDLTAALGLQGAGEG